MKQTAVSWVRVVVGTLFVLSGLVKANDPLGLSYKMEEFFEVWNTSLKDGSVVENFLHFLAEHSLALSLFMNGLEILAGIALLIGWKRKFVLGLLLALIVFFTFLTGFAYSSGKFQNCGCFGDCLPITPLASFIKDLFLLTLIVFLWVNRRYLTPLMAPRKMVLALILSTLFISGMQWYVLHYLPFADCLPFKKQNSIPEQMKMPANALADSFRMKFIYRRDGKTFEFAPDQLPADLATYTFVDRTQELVRKGNAEPPIKGFALASLDGIDFTNQILAEPEAVLVFALHFNNIAEWMPSFQKVYQEARAQGIPVFIVSSDAARGKVILAPLLPEEVVFLACDHTVIRTAARTNPTFYIIRQGRIIAKQSAAKVDYLLPQL